MIQAMRSGGRWAVIILLAASLLSGCSLFARNKSPADDRNYMTRGQLNAGYSLLYQAGSSLRHVDKGLFLKVESDRLDEIISGIAQYGGELRADMRQLEEDHSALDIGLDPLPEMEQRRRSALRKTNLKRYAPIVGLSGPAFERELLLSTSAALNQLVFMFRIMAEGEPEDALSNAMVLQERRAQRLYDQAGALLQSEHFRQ